MYELQQRIALCFQNDVFPREITKKKLKAGAEYKVQIDERILQVNQSVKS